MLVRNAEHKRGESVVVYGHFICQQKAIRFPRGNGQWRQIPIDYSYLKQEWPGRLKLNPNTKQWFLDTFSLLCVCESEDA